MKLQDSLILIVDDTQANLKLLSNVLANEGYNYIEATNGEEAIGLAKENKPDLILLDIMMPGLNGYEVIRELKDIDELSEIPVIFLSSLTDTNDKVQAFREGGVDYITKPFQKEEALARIRAHLQIRFLQKQLNERIKILREREVELSRLNQKKDKLVRTVSHDIKNPLTGIIGLVKLMKVSDKVSEDEKTQMLSVIEESGNNLLNLVREILDREAKKVESEELNYSTVPIFDVIDRVVSMNKAKSLVKKIGLSYSVKPKNLVAEIDSNKIEIAVNNLVSNALKFTPSGGDVWVDVSQKKETIYIEVRDNGIGIPPKMQPDLFVDKNNTYSTKGTSGEVGTGLGLDIVQLYIELHGGQISVESELDKGTTFYIKFPKNKIS
ncbi:MAG: hybrid sensor histidine kinase/response regulator [Gracilimonas sp.]|nr:hybrid sensor histidine kinase/response regulator [Gracilimonas sp.]